VTNEETTDPDKQFNLGRNLLYGYVGEPDIVKGCYWLEKAAAQNHAKALMHLGSLYLYGHHYPADPQHGLELIQRSLEAGNMEALNTLGSFFLEENCPATYDKAKGADYFRQAAEIGNYSGLFNYALWNELEGNFTEAVKWFRRAVEARHPIARYRLAGLLADGKGVAQDIDEAFKLYMYAGSEQQYPLGYYGCATLLDDPKYGRQDLREAAGFYFLAADKGVAEAQLRYAELAELGHGSPDQPYDAYVWTRVAMEHLPKEEMPRAQATLARIKEKLGPWRLRPADDEAAKIIAFLKPYGRC
jgi:TPR repeat protein